MSISQAKTEQNRTLEGIGWMVLTGFMFACVTGVVRHLGSDMPAIEAAFIRYAIGLLLILPLVIRTLRKHKPTAEEFKLYSVRGLVHGIAALLEIFKLFLG